MLLEPSKIQTMSTKAGYMHVGDDVGTLIEGDEVGSWEGATVGREVGADVG